MADNFVSRLLLIMISDLPIQTARIWIGRSLRRRILADEVMKRLENRVGGGSSGHKYINEYLPVVCAKKCYFGEERLQWMERRTREREGRRVF